MQVGGAYRDRVGLGKECLQLKIKKKFKLEDIYNVYISCADTIKGDIFPFDSIETVKHLNKIEQTSLLREFQEMKADTRIEKFEPIKNGELRAQGIKFLVEISVETFWDKDSSYVKQVMDFKKNLDT